MQLLRSAAVRVFAIFLLVAAHPFASRAADPVPEPSSISTHTISLVDFGAQDVAFLAIPEEAPVGGVVLVSDGWGITADLQAVAQFFAQAGFVAIAPDLFNGRKATSASDASQLEQSLRPAIAEKTLAGAVRFLKESPKYRTEAVGIVGWQVGAFLALHALANPNSTVCKQVDAAALFYPLTPFPEEKHLKRLRAPLLLFSTPLQAPEMQTFVQLLQRLEKPAQLSVVESADATGLGPRGFLQSESNDAQQSPRNQVVEFFKRLFAPKTAAANP